MQEITYRITEDGELLEEKILEVQQKWFLDDYFKYIAGIKPSTDVATGANSDHTWVEIVFLDYNLEKVFTLAQEVFMKLKDPQFGWTRRSWGRAFNYRPGYLAGFRIHNVDSSRTERAPFIVCSLEECGPDAYGWMVIPERSRAVKPAELRKLYEKIIKAGGEGIMKVNEYPVLAL